MESSIGFFNVNFVARDSFLGVVSSDVMDEVEEAYHGVAKYDIWDFLLSYTLVD